MMRWRGKFSFYVSQSAKIWYGFRPMINEAAPWGRRQQQIFFADAVA
jgi:hypothetical protein